jgi:hypothetical protein
MNFGKGRRKNAPKEVKIIFLGCIQALWYLSVQSLVNPTKVTYPTGGPDLMPCPHCSHDGHGESKAVNPEEKT